MKTVTKWGVVIGGYAGAILLAAAAVALNAAFTKGVDAQAASGMYAFGDLLLFLGVFGIAGLIPTGIALFFLRPYRAFWDVISRLGITIASTGIIAALLFAFGRRAPTTSPLGALASYSVLRLMIAPLLLFVFLVCAALSAYRVPRLLFLAASALEAVSAVIVWACLALFTPH